MVLPSSAAPTDPVFGMVVSIVHAVPEQSVNRESPLPLNVEWICSRIDSASMVWVLSILLRLLVAIDAMIRLIMLREQTTRMPPATRVSTIEIPACGSRLFTSESRRTGIRKSRIMGGLYDSALGL